MAKPGLGAVLTLAIVFTLSLQPVKGTDMFSGDRLFDDDTLTTDAGNFTLMWTDVFKFGCLSNNMRSLRWRDNSSGATAWTSAFDDSWEQYLGSHMNQTQCAAYVLHMQSDGNLVLYTNPTETVSGWHTATHGNDGARFALQDDGNLVIYTASEVPIWAIM